MKKLSAEELASLSGEDVSAIRRLQRLGLLGTEGATERFTEEDAMRLRLIRQYLDEGLPLRDLVDAAQGGRLPTAYIERFFPPVAAKKYSLTEAGDRAGVEAGFAETVLRAIALAPSEGEQLLSDDDVQALILVKRLMDSGLPDQALVEIAHVVGDTLARLAETEAQLLHAHTHGQMAASGVPELEIARDLKRLPHSLLPAIQPLIEHVHRRYLEQAARDDAATHLEAAAGLLCKGQSPGQTKVALAFADLASFTPLAEVHGDEVAGHVLERYSEMVRETARRFQGRVVKQIGDAFMMAFAEPTAAVRWATSLDELVRLEPQFPGVRVGIHYGEALQREGDYLGTAVNLAARLASGAERHQILVSKAVVDEVEDVVDLTFREVGERQLKGFVAPVQLFEVAVPGGMPQVRPIDPVCGMELDPDDIVARLSMAGAERVFCSPDCVQRFVANPQRYLS